MRGDVKLAPTQPPGRITRKARDFEVEIVRLRSQGYTLEAIRQSLVGVGVPVSISTVRREANRHAVPSRAAAEATCAPKVSSAVVSASAATSAAASATTAASTAAITPAEVVSMANPPARTSAKELAEAFARSKSTNPLIRAKEQP